MPEICAESKIIAKMVAAAFGGSPKVTRYWDEDEKSHVDLLICADRPQSGVMSFSTVSLWKHSMSKAGVEFPVRIELVGTCGSQFPAFDQVMATAAFCIINSKWLCHPGAIFPDVLSMYKCSTTLRHLFFVPPFLWEKELRTLDLAGRKIAWLLAVTISEAERMFCVEQGPDKLEKLFEQKQIDINDLDRASVI